MASSRNFFLRRVRLTNIKDALTNFPLRFEWRFHRFHTYKYINRDCTGQYHFRNKISKSDQKEKDEADSRLAPKFHPATTRPRLGVVPCLRGETYRTWRIWSLLDSTRLVTSCFFRVTDENILKRRVYTPSIERCIKARTDREAGNVHELSRVAFWKLVADIKPNRPSKVLWQA